MFKNILILLFLVSSTSWLGAQSYAAAFKSDICDCLPEQLESQRNINRALERCFRKALPTYAAQIDAAINEENAIQRYQKGQKKRSDLMYAFKHEMVYSCDLYFETLEANRSRQLEQGQAATDEEDLVNRNELVAMQPNFGTYLERGRTHFFLGNLKEAESDFRESLRLYEEIVKNVNIPAVYLLAWVLEEQKQYSQAFQLLNKEYNNRPIYTTALFRALAHRKSGGNSPIPVTAKPTEQLNKTEAKETDVVEKLRRSRADSPTNNSERRDKKKEKPKVTTDLNKLFQVKDKKKKNNNNL